MLEREKSVFNFLGEWDILFFFLLEIFGSLEEQTCLEEKTEEKDN